MCQCFKMVFLEIQSVTTWSVFPNPVTFIVIQLYAASEQDKLKTY